MHCIYKFPSNTSANSDPKEGSSDYERIKRELAIGWDFPEDMDTKPLIFELCMIGDEKIWTSSHCLEVPVRQIASASE